MTGGLHCARRHKRHLGSVDLWCLAPEPCAAPLPKLPAVHGAQTSALPGLHSNSQEDSPCHKSAQPQVDVTETWLNKSCVGCTVRAQARAKHGSKVMTVTSVSLEHSSRGAKFNNSVYYNTREEASIAGFQAAAGENWLFGEHPLRAPA